MKHSDFSKLPIIISYSPLTGFRKFYFPLAALSFGYGLIVLIWGRALSIGDEASPYFFLALGITAVFELLGHLFGWFSRKQYVIDKQGVHFNSASNNWFEPLSSYTSIIWYESIHEIAKHSPSNVRRDILERYIYLSHESDTKLSVILFSLGIFSNKRKALEKCHVLSKTMDLPFKQIGGTGVELSKVHNSKGIVSNKIKNTVSDVDEPISSPENKKLHKNYSELSDKELKLEINTAVRGFRLFAPCLFAFIGIVTIIQFIANNELIISYMTLFLLVLISIGILIIWIGLIFSNYRLTVSPDSLTVMSYIGRYKYNIKVVDWQNIVNIIKYQNTSTRISSITIQCTDQNDIVLSTLYSFEALRVKNFIENLIN